MGRYHGKKKAVAYMQQLFYAKTNVGLFQKTFFTRFFYTRVDSLFVNDTNPFC